MEKRIPTIFSDSSKLLQILLFTASLVLVASLIFLFQNNSDDISAHETPAGQGTIESKMSKVEIPFIENLGQINENVNYYADTFAGSVFVTKTGEIVYSFPPSQFENSGTKALAIKESFSDGLPALVLGEGASDTKISYFNGSDESDWQSGLNTYGTISLGEIYKGIDVKLKAYGENVEKLFYVSPGADPADILINIEGNDSLSVSKNGELIISSEIGDISFTSPIAYQEIEGQRVDIDVKYFYKGNQYGFILGEYDNTKELIIDPLLASTYLGAYSSEKGFDISLDASNNVYVTGVTNSTGFPVTPGAYDTYHSVGCGPCGGSNYYDSFVAKFDSNLTTLIAATYLGSGGASQSEHGQGIALDQSGNVFVSGTTKSYSFPTTPGAYDTGKSGYSDIFISKLSNDLTTLLASTYLGGSDSDRGYGIAIDVSNNIYVSGITYSDTGVSDYPVTTGAYDENYNDGSNDAVVTKLDNNLSTVLASTFVGGSGTEGPASFSADDSPPFYPYINLDSTGNVFIVGATSSIDYPTTTGAYLEARPGYSSVYISKLTADLSTLSASTYLGGSSSNIGYEIDFDTSNNIYVTGRTNSSDFPTTIGAYDTTKSGNTDIFISKLDNNLASLLGSTYLSTSDYNYSYAIEVDGNDNVFITGQTNSPTFPTTAGAYNETFSDTYNIFIAKFNDTLTSLLSSTFLNGGTGYDSQFGYALASDTNNNIYAAGVTSSYSFPTTVGAFDRSLTSSYADVFVSKIDNNLSADINNQPNDLLLSNTNINENLNPGYVVGSFSTEDPNAGDSHTYSLVSGNGDDDNASFTVAGNNLQTNFASDYETQSEYSIRVRTTDNGTDPDNLWFESQFTVKINDLDEGGNEPPKKLSLSSSSLYENQAINTVVGNFSTDDIDSVDNHNYGLVAGEGDADNASFNINGSELRSSAVFDYETKNSFSIRARTTDSGNLWIERQFTITINNVNEAASGYDPIFESTFLGGSDVDSVQTLTAGPDGYVYASGYTRSTNFPTTIGVYDTQLDEGEEYSYDVFVSKFDANLATLISSTYLGGNSSDYPTKIIVDNTGKVYITGYTYSVDFPTTPGSYERIFGGYNDGFVAILNNELDNLLNSTYLGGRHKDEINDMALDSSGNVYVTGDTSSANYPATSGSYNETSNGSGDIFVAKFNPDLSSLVSSTYLGGSDQDYGTGIVIQNTDVYVSGRTGSSNYPATAGAYDESFNAGYYDFVVSKFDNNLAALTASTYLGGSDQEKNEASIGIDSTGYVYIAGETSSTNFPISANAFDQGHNGYTDIVIAKLNNNLSTLMASTFLGGNSNDFFGTLFSSDNEIYVSSAYSSSADFPVTPGAYDSEKTGWGDATLSKLSTDLTTMLSSTFLGGSGFDDDYGYAITVNENLGYVYIAGKTDSSDFPTSSNAYDTTYNDTGAYYDGFITKFDETLYSGMPAPSDFGDAPDPAYPTLSSSNGAEHQINGAVKLGSLIDSEIDGQQDTAAMGDDLTDKDDDDGVNFTSQLVEGASASLDVTASTSGFLNAWIDFNDDGDWADGGEKIFSDQNLSAGVNALNFAVPSATANTKTFARFRFNTTGGLSYDGFASDGEVEDYEVGIGQFTVPYSENFEDSFLPPGWIETTVSGTTGKWSWISNSAHPTGIIAQDGSKFTAFNSYDAPNGDQARLETPSLDFTGKANMALRFWMYHDSGYSYLNDRIQPQVNTGSGFINVGSPISRYKSSSGWLEHLVDLSAYDGLSGIVIGLAAISASGNDMHIDNLKVLENICLTSLCNGDFESTIDLDYWKSGNGTNQIVTDIVQDGTRAYYTEHTYSSSVGPRWSGIWQKVMVESAQTYGLTGFYQSENAAQGHIKISWKDISGTVLQVDYPVINMSGTNTNWIEFSKLVIAPAGAATAEIKIWHGVNTSSQNVLGSKLWVDSLAFEVATTACGTLCNESFEHGILYWIQSGAVGSHTIEQTGVHEGLKALKSEQLYTSSDPAKWAGVTQFAQVKEGTTYRLRLWLKKSNLSNAHVRIRWRDQSGSLLSTQYPLTGINGTSLSWYKREVNVTAPANAVKAEISIWHGVSGGVNIPGSTMWLDDITMICQSLCNGGFEDGNVHWETNGINEGEIITTDVQEGAQAVKIVQSLGAGDQTQWAGVSQRFIVSGGLSYNLNFWMKKENAVQGHVKIKWRDTNDQLISQQFPIGGINGTDLTWTEMSTTLSAPATAETVEVFIWHGVNGSNQNATGSTLYMDNVTFLQAP